MPRQQRERDSLKESEIFHILGNDRRRAIIQALAERNGQTDVSEIATGIAETESDKTTVPNNLYKSVYVSLQQTHLPRLEEDNVITYDSDGKTIEPGSNFADVLTYVDGFGTDHSEILLGHLLVSIGGLLVIALHGFGIPGLSRIDPVYLTVIVLVIVAGSSLYVVLD